MNCISQLTICKKRNLSSHTARLWERVRCRAPDSDRQRRTGRTPNSYGSQSCLSTYGCSACIASWTAGDTMCNLIQERCLLHLGRGHVCASRLHPDCSLGASGQLQRCMNSQRFHTSFPASLLPLSCPLRGLDSASRTAFRVAAQRRSALRTRAPCP